MPKYDPVTISSFPYMAVSVAMAACNTPPKEHIAPVLQRQRGQTYIPTAARGSARSLIVRTFAQNVQNAQRLCKYYPPPAQKVKRFRHEFRFFCSNYTLSAYTRAAMHRFYRQTQNRAYRNGMRGKVFYKPPKASCALQAIVINVCVKVQTGFRHKRKGNENARKCHGRQIVEKHSYADVKNDG